MKSPHVPEVFFAVLSPTGLARSNNSSLPTRAAVDSDVKRRITKRRRSTLTALTATLSLIGLACSSDSTSPEPEEPTDTGCGYQVESFNRGLATNLLNALKEATSRDLALGDSLYGCWDLVAANTTGEVQFYIGATNATKDLVIAFPGSDGDYDWAHNFIVDPQDWEQREGCDPVPINEFDLAVHSGFKKAYQEVQEELQEKLFAALPAPVERAEARVFITGHSQGGALATLCALDLVNCLVGEGYKRENVVMYAFAGPRTINSGTGFYNEYSNLVPNSYNIVNYEDVVPHLLGHLDEYTHIPNLIVLVSNPRNPDEERADARKTRIDHIEGPEYDKDNDLCGAVELGILSNDYHHFPDYSSRLESVKSTSPYPNIAIGVGAGSQGLIAIGYTGSVAGACDAIALFEGNPATGGQLVRSSVRLVARDTDGDPADCPLDRCYLTSTMRYSGYWVAYIDEFQRVINSKQYVVPTPGLTCKKKLGGAEIEVAWSNAGDAGQFDFVALYDHNPSGRGDDEIVGTKHRVWTNRSDIPAGNRSFPAVIGKSYWAAYVMQDGDLSTSRSKILISKRCN